MAHRTYKYIFRRFGGGSDSAQSTKTPTTHAVLFIYNLQSGVRTKRRQMRLTAAQRTCINEFISRQIEFHFHISARGTRGQSIGSAVRAPGQPTQMEYYIMCVRVCVYCVVRCRCRRRQPPRWWGSQRAARCGAARRLFVFFFYSRGNELCKILSELLHMCPWPDRWFTFASMTFWFVHIHIHPLRRYTSPQSRKKTLFRNRQFELKIPNCFFLSVLRMTDIKMVAKSDDLAIWATNSQPSFVIMLPI